MYILDGLRASEFSANLHFRVNYYVTIIQQQASISVFCLCWQWTAREFSRFRTTAKMFPTGWISLTDLFVWKSNRDAQLTEIYDVYCHRMCAWRQRGDELFVFNCVRVQTTDLHTSVAMITHQAVQQQSALGEFWFFLRRQHSQKE